ncbi:LytR/AlgR family response regulator transcription factor [Spirosoma endophyticum]|uniref:Two component transcriptional regulator, LytTR family n=1 Tax=Spirosoma endophyticum TaxID=662367 RepID=A0A1I1WUK8_9BACT|nr:LytTR family DNA-binding domain-containing protein [Spirosoma endophyticum]SFD98827.1 two component transcriptional regulator, LytTR family [Spirosoma endophyticum]
MMDLLRCAIIEDEPLAQELLEKYVRRVSSLELVGTFDDAIAAFEQLPALRPDVIFLDINMPEMTGIEFLKAYPTPHPIVVMTTANPHHALDGFDLGVMDYLLKPISFDRFLKTIGRIRGKADGQSNKVDAAAIAALTTDDVVASQAVSRAPDFMYLKTDKKLEQIRFDDIVFIEALGDYLKVFLPDRYVVTHLTMTKLVENLPADRFLRINRSYIVQLQYIKTLDGNMVTTSTSHNLTIGPNYRDVVKDALKKWLVN